MPKFSLILSLILVGYGCTSPPAHPPMQTGTSAPPSTPNSFSKDAVVISFIKDASDGMDEISACLSGYDTYRFVLKGDGHLVRFDGAHYVETAISQSEINKLLSEIDAAGFSSLKGDGDQYSQNAPPPSFNDTWGGSITISQKTIRITPGQSGYLVEPIKKTLNIIENYRPRNLHLYAPESMMVWVFREKDFRLGKANPTPEPPVLKWSLEDINLGNLLTDPAISKPQIVSADTLGFLMQQLKHLPVVRRVEQNGRNYLVLGCPNFS